MTRGLALRALTRSSADVLLHGEPIGRVERIRAGRWYGFTPAGRRVSTGHTSEHAADLLARRALRERRRERMACLIHA